MFGLDLFGTKRRKEAKLMAEAKARSDERTAIAKRIAELDDRNKRNAAEQDARNQRYIAAQRKTAADRRNQDDSPTPNLFWGTTLVSESNASYSPPSSSSYDSGSSYTPPAASYSSSSYDSGSSYSSSCDSSSSSSSSCSSGGD